MALRGHRNSGGLNTEAETTSSTTSPEKRLLCLLSVYQGREEPLVLEAVEQTKGGDFCTVGPLLPLIVIPCSVSKFHMAVSAAVHQLASLSLIEFR